MALTSEDDRRLVEVLDHFRDLSVDQRAVLSRLYALIVDVAVEIGTVPLSLETRWNQPSLRPPSRVGTPIRLGITDDGDVALLVHCQTSVIPTLQDVAGDRLRFDGTRGVLFSTDGEIDDDLLRTAIEHALSYRRTPLGAAGS